MSIVNTTEGDIHPEKAPVTAVILMIEAFYGGSHKQLVDLLVSELKEHVHLCTLPAKKWHWRARTSALYFAQCVPASGSYSVLFCSSVLNLAELVALRPDLSKLKKILYFHENQLVYPVRKQQDRDFQYGYSQILSCLVADEVVFNSRFNMDSFLSNISTFLKLIPDHRPKGIADQLRPKCRVLYFPILFRDIIASFKPCCGEHCISDNCDTTCDCVLTSQVKPKAEIDEVVTQAHTETLQQSDSIGHLRNFNTDAVNLGAESKIDDKVSAGEHSDKQLNAKDDNNKEESTVSRDETHSQERKAKKQCLETGIHPASVQNQVSCGCSTVSGVADNLKPLHIVWPHRWEHDKDPETFFRILKQLHEEGQHFKVSVLGETYTDVPEIFHTAREELSEHISHWGYLSSKAEYYQVLKTADVVVSTAQHEFFGVAMIEAVFCGCFPLCPKKLVYPEIFKSDIFLYNTENQLLKKLRSYCKKPRLVRNREIELDLKVFSWEELKPHFMALLQLQKDH